MWLLRKLSIVREKVSIWKTHPACLKELWWPMCRVPKFAESKWQTFTQTRQSDEVLHISIEFSKFHSAKWSNKVTKVGTTPSCGHRNNWNPGWINSLPTFKQSPSTIRESMNTWISVALNKHNRWKIDVQIRSREVINLPYNSLTDIY
jgi:hypothetical protein